MVSRAVVSTCAAASLLHVLVCAAPAPEQPDLPLPASARLVSTSDGPRDLQGDAEHAVVYELSRADAQAVVAAPMWWMREGAGKWRSRARSQRPSPSVAWQHGRLPSELLEIATGAFGADGPDGRRPPEGIAVRTYHYAFKHVEGGWRRLVIVDVERGRLFYYRSTW